MQTLCANFQKIFPSLYEYSRIWTKWYVGTAAAQAPILDRNLEWLEDSAFENPEVDKDGETSPEEISIKRTSPTSPTIPNAKKQKSTTSTTSCDIPNKSASVMCNVKGRG